MSERNLFTGIVKNENDVTELLVNLMHLDKNFRIACLRSLFSDVDSTAEDIFEKVTASDIKTQVFKEGCGIPDIVICDNSNAPAFLIENKIHVKTPLTYHQINDYLSILTSKFHRRLVFLVPRGYDNLGVIELLQKDATEKNIVSIVYWDEFLSSLNKLQGIGFIYEQALKHMKYVIDNAMPIMTQLTAEEKRIIKSDNLYEFLATMERKLVCCLESSKLKNKRYIEQRDQHGIGLNYKNDNGQDCFIGFSPEVTNKKYYLAESTFSKIKYAEYFEWDDWAKGYWNYTTLDIVNEELRNLPNKEIVHNIYVLTDKIIELCRRFISDSKLHMSHSQVDPNGVGVYFDDDEHTQGGYYFIGIDPSNNNLLYVSGKSNAKFNDKCIRNDDICWYYVTMKDFSLFDNDNMRLQQMKFNEAAKKSFNTVNNCLDENKAWIQKYKK